MTRDRQERAEEGGQSDASPTGHDKARDDQEAELEAEQESAAAMDSDVPQPQGTSETTEGQPS